MLLSINMLRLCSARKRFNEIMAALVFIVAGIPETKGKSLEELESILARSRVKSCPIPSASTKKNRPQPIP